jgi:sec-independent protein translocase protein TatB
MLDVGFSEILLTSAIALIVLGPERLPKVARQVGNWMGRARAMARQLSEQLEREVTAEELLKTQSKSTSGTGLPASSTPSPHSGGAFDPPYTPSAESQPALAAPSAIASAPAAVPTVDAPATDAPAPREPDPIFGGLPPSATTPAAMHAADPPVAASQPPHE